MIIRYVWKNFRRRKVRTFLMLMALTVGIALVVTLSAMVETVSRSNIDIIASQTGRFDITILRTDISSDPYIPIDTASTVALNADPAVQSVHPRFESSVEFTLKGIRSNGTLLAIDTARDNIGAIDVLSGTYPIEPGAIALLEETAFSVGLAVGDVVQVAYFLPIPREEGKESAAGISQQRIVTNFTVGAIIRQNGVTTAGVRDGGIVNIEDMQTQLGLPNVAERLLIVVDPDIYDANDASAAAIQVREVAQKIQSDLDLTYRYGLEKASILDQAAEAFLIIQALVNIYGVTSLGIIGLLVHTLIMTNVQEQQREMAILRILGSQRSYLFSLVIGEVFVIGAISIIAGSFLGQLLNQYAVIPLIERFAAQQGTVFSLQPEVTLDTILPALIAAALVLFLSALQPARNAANTKVMHAINPGAADNIQIEDITNLRERRPNLRLFLIGLLMCWFFVMILGLQLVSTLGNPGLEATIIFSAFMLMVIGVGLLFFITTVPFEKLILLISNLIVPRFTYFASRNVGRGQTRNTLISLLVLFSAILPSFLASNLALSNANLETDVKMSIGAPVDIHIWGGGQLSDNADDFRLRPSYVEREIRSVAGMDDAVGVTYSYGTNVADTVGMRSASLRVVGVSGPLTEVIFNELAVYENGTPPIFNRILSEDRSIIISAGLANHLSVGVGDTIELRGEGIDNLMMMEIIGVMGRVPGYDGFQQSRSSAFGSTAFVSINAFKRLATAPLDTIPDADAPIYTRVMANLTPDADPDFVSNEIRQRVRQNYPAWVDMLEVQRQRAEDDALQQQLFLIVLTVISFTTAVFGVFAVIYVTIYARRMEIGMLKAIGMRNWELTGTLVIEAITMTLSAALAGITAGTVMGFVVYMGENIGAGRPFTFALDTTVGPFIVLMVVLASVISATFSARRIIKQKAIEILRMA